MTLQCGINLPILLLASAQLFLYARQEGYKKILFSTRDGIPWMHIFDRFCHLIGGDYSPKIERFYTSRLARKNPSDDYLDYARSVISNDSLVVDLCGTGWSLSHLAARLGIKQMPILLLHRFPPMQKYEDASPTPTNCKIISINQQYDANVWTAYLEMINAQSYGSIVDVKKIGHIFAPVMDDDEFRSADTLRWIHLQGVALDVFQNTMTPEHCKAALHASPGSFLELTHWTRHMQLLSSLYGESHVKEDTTVYQRLGVSANG